MVSSLIRLRDSVVLDRRQQHVLADVDLHPITFANRDRRWDVNETIQHSGGILRQACGDAVLVGINAIASECAAAVGHFRGSANDPERDRSPEYREIVVVDLVLESGLANLIESLKLVKVNRVAVRHNHAVEDNGHTPLLAETSCADLARFSEHDCAFRYQDVLMIVRVDGSGYHHLYRSCSISVKAIH